jgi:hypothetical protein
MMGFSMMLDVAFLYHNSGATVSGTSSARPSCFRAGLSRLINEQNIRTPQRIEDRGCNDTRLLATDMKLSSCGLRSMRVMCLEYSIRN